MSTRRRAQPTRRPIRPGPRPCQAGARPEPRPGPGPGPTLESTTRLSDCGGRIKFSSGVENAAVRTDDESTPPAVPSAEFMSSVPKATAPKAPSPGGGAASGRVDGPRDANDMSPTWRNTTATRSPASRISAPRVSSEQPADDDIELVTAAMCADGHPNPAHRTSCRVCGARGGDVAHPRPAAFARDGAQPHRRDVRAHRADIIGRKPRVDRVQGTAHPTTATAAARPRQRQPSAAADRGLDRAGRRPAFEERNLPQTSGSARRSAARNPTPLAAGDVLDLGHGVQLTFKDLP